MTSAFRSGANEIFRSSGMLRSVDCYLVTDVSWQPIGYIFEDQAVRSKLLDSWKPAQIGSYVIDVSGQTCRSHIKKLSSIPTLRDNL